MIPVQSQAGLSAAPDFNLAPGEEQLVSAAHAMSKLIRQNIFRWGERIVFGRYINSFSFEIWILHAALAVILQADEQITPRRVAEMAMVAAAFPAAVTELQQHFAVGLRREDEFLRRADPFRRGAAGALPAHQ